MSMEEGHTLLLLERSHESLLSSSSKLLEKLIVRTDQSIQRVKNNASKCNYRADEAYLMKPTVNFYMKNTRNFISVGIWLPCFSLVIRFFFVFVFFVKSETRTLPTSLIYWVNQYFLVHVGVTLSDMNTRNLSWFRSSWFYWVSRNDNKDGVSFTSSVREQVFIHRREGLIITLAV